MQKLKKKQTSCFSIFCDGTVEMPIDNSPWGSYFGMFRDKIYWMDGEFWFKKLTTKNNLEKEQQVI